jgi:hypothetical protein
MGARIPASTLELAEHLVEVLCDLPSFGALVEIPTKDRGKLPFGYDVWHPEQRQFERERTGRDVVLKPRQIGFSTIELARDLQFARTHEGVQVVVVVHTDAAKVELFSRVHTMVRALERLGLVPEPRESTKTGFRWDDVDSSIKIVEAGKDAKSAADKGRSGTIHRLHCTEVAFYREPEETMVALLAASDRAEIVIESTANGTGTWFHDCVTQTQAGRFEDFAFHFYPWMRHPDYVADPRIYSTPPATRRHRYWEDKLIALGARDEQIAWWRKTVSGPKGLDKALREYPCTPEAAFTESAQTWLEPEAIDSLRAAVVAPIDERRVHRTERPCGPLRVYEHPEEGAHYILFADPSEGVGNNEAAIVVIEHRSARVVACWHDNRTKPGELGHIVGTVGRLYNTALAAIERNAWRREKGDQSDGGRTTLAVLERDERYPLQRIYRDQQGKLGWATTGESRPLIFGDLQLAIDEGATTPDRKMVDEAASLVTGSDGKPRARAKRGLRGDDGLFVAWGGARQVRERVPMPGSRKVTAQTVGPALESSRFRT